MWEFVEVKPIEVWNHGWKKEKRHETKKRTKNDSKWNQRRRHTGEISRRARVVGQQRRLLGRRRQRRRRVAVAAAPHLGRRREGRPLALAQVLEQRSTDSQSDPSHRQDKICIPKRKIVHEKPIIDRPHYKNIKYYLIICADNKFGSDSQ